MSKKKFPEPKNKKTDSKQSEIRQGVVRNPNGGGTESDHTKHTHIKHSHVNTHKLAKPSVRALDFVDEIDKAELGVEDSVQLGIEKNRQARRRHTAAGRQRGGYPKMNEARIMWENEFEKVFEFRPVDNFTIKEWGRFKRNTKSSPVKNIEEFFANVCNAWDSLLQTQLKWADDLGEFPTFQNVAVLVRHIRVGLKDVEVYDQKQRDKLKSNIKVTNKVEYQEEAEREYRASVGVDPARDDVFVSSRELSPEQIRTLSEHIENNRVMLPDQTVRTEITEQERRRVVESRTGVPEENSPEQDDVAYTPGTAGRDELNLHGMDYSQMEERVLARMGTTELEGHWAATANIFYDVGDSSNGLREPMIGDFRLRSIDRVLLELDVYASSRVGWVNTYKVITTAIWGDTTSYSEKIVLLKR